MREENNRSALLFARTDQVLDIISALRIIRSNCNQSMANSQGMTYDYRRHTRR